MKRKKKKEPRMESEQESLNEKRIIQIRKEKNTRKVTESPTSKKKIYKEKVMATTEK